MEHERSPGRVARSRSVDKRSCAIPRYLASGIPVVGGPGTFHAQQVCCTQRTSYLGDHGGTAVNHRTSGARVLLDQQGLRALCQAHSGLKSHVVLDASPPAFRPLWRAQKAIQPPRMFHFQNQFSTTHNLPLYAGWDKVETAPHSLSSVSPRLIGKTTLQNHAHSITLEEYNVIVKTCPDVQKVVLGVENGHYRDYRSHLFVMFQTRISL